MRVVFWVNASAAPHAALVRMTGQIVEFGTDGPLSRTARLTSPWVMYTSISCGCARMRGFGERLGKWAGEQFRYRALAPTRPWVAALADLSELAVGRSCRLERWRPGAAGGAGEGDFQRVLRALQDRWTHDLPVVCFEPATPPPSTA
jgi:hypothetical protein